MGSVLDPVRVSVVCPGPELLLQVARWFIRDSEDAAAAAAAAAGGGSEGRGRAAEGTLRVLRIKNKFALPREQVNFPFPNRGVHPSLISCNLSRSRHQACTYAVRLPARRPPCPPAGLSESFARRLTPL